MNNRSLAFYLSGCYLLGLILCSQFIDFAGACEWQALAFSLLLLLTSPALFLLPALVFWWLLYRWLPAGWVSVNLRQRLLVGGIYLLSSLASLFLFADAKLYDLYGFHINGFVLNLVMTPGGVQSLGASDGTYLMSGLFGSGFFLLHAILMGLSARLAGWKFPFTTRQLAMALVLLLLAEKSLYAWSDVENYGLILNQAASVPLYKGLTARKMITRLGYEVPDRHEVQLGSSSGVLNYPLAPITLTDATQRPNVIFLVAESLRWDMLTPEIMPQTMAFSTQAIRLENHYSGGNGTRQGLFSLMYSLHGNYWDQFLRAQRGPVLIETLKARDYQFFIRTSASFTYPEFDQTLFVDVPDAAISEADEQLTPWKRDELNTDSMVEYLAAADPNKPFMMFMFYESTHARYDFPDEAAIRQPYLESLNYATMSRDSLRGEIDQLKNRYVNASHWVDVQAGRVYAALAQANLLDNTIVVVTGDHGEEFMENGFWGHNSGFSEWQVRVPMVIHLPNQPAQVVTARTSHLDIVPSMAGLLGIENPLSDFAVGLPFDQAGSRQNIVISDWHGLAMVSDDYKFTIPLKASLQSRNQLFTRDDKLLEDIGAYLVENQEDMQRILTESRRFSEPRKK